MTPLFCKASSEKDHFSVILSFVFLSRWNLFWIVTGDEKSTAFTLTLLVSLLYQIVREERSRLCVWIFRRMNYFLRSDRQLFFPGEYRIPVWSPEKFSAITVAAFWISLWHLYGIIFWRDNSLLKYIRPWPYLIPS